MMREPELLRRLRLWCGKPTPDHGFATDRPMALRLIDWIDAHAAARDSLAASLESERALREGLERELAKADERIELLVDVLSEKLNHEIDCSKADWPDPEREGK